MKILENEIVEEVRSRVNKSDDSEKDENEVEICEDVHEVSVMSNRLYLDEDAVSQSDFDKISDNITEFQKIVFHVYNLLFLRKTDPNQYNKINITMSLFLYVRLKFGVSSYYANEAVRVAEQILKGQIEFQKYHIEQVEAQIKAKSDVISETEKRIKKLLDLQKRVHDCEKASKNGKNKKLVMPKGLNIHGIKIDKTGKIFAKNEMKEFVEISIWKFDYEFVQKEIKKAQQSLGRFKHRLRNLKSSLERAKILRRAIFGSKAFMRKYTKRKYTRQQYLFNKYKTYRISGRNDFLYSNACIRPIYDEESKTFTIQLCLSNYDEVFIKNVVFPYRSNELIKLINKMTYNEKTVDKDGKRLHGNPICGQVVVKKDGSGRTYLQIIFSFNLAKVAPKQNFDKSTGIIGIDFNVGHLDFANIDKIGNLKHTETVKYDVFKKSGQNEMSLILALNKVFQYAKSQNKIVAVEELEMKELMMKNNHDKKSQKDLNRHLHNFPFMRYQEIVDSLSYKYGLEVITVKPQFTSIIGRLKYADTLKLNQHQSAAFVIARRGLGIKSEVPLENQRKMLADKGKEILDYKSNWSLWSALNKMKTA